MKRLCYKEVIAKSRNKTKTTWNIIHKEKGNLTNENIIKSVRVNNRTVHNQISIANELIDYFINIAGRISNKRINKKLHYKIYLNTLISHLKMCIGLILPQKK